MMLLLLGSYAANETGLTALSEYDCGCPGESASYICTVFGGVIMSSITVWGGSAFNCTDGLNEIPLVNDQFGLENARGECNDGALIAYGIQAAENCYTSRLDVRLSADLQGRTITCSVESEENGVTLLGNKTLIVSTVTSGKSVTWIQLLLNFLMLSNNILLITLSASKSMIQHYLHHHRVSLL